MAGIATPTTKSQAFLNLGNLAFYDGWHPDYVYFKTLYKAHTTFGLKKGPSPWDAGAAGAIADQAIADAKTNANLNQMSEEESITYFLDQFNKISTFLQQAITAEEASESAYIKEKLEQIRSIFPKKERKQIEKLNKLEDLLIEAENGEKIELDKMNALINAIQYGFENAQVLMDYEQQRIEKLNKVLGDLIKSRGNQANGLGKKFGLSADQRLEMRQRAEDKYKKAITDEYVETGRITRTTEDKDYVLWGAATIKKEVPLAMDRIFANWLNQTLAIVIKSKTFIEDVKGILQADNIPINGNFNLLEDKVKEAVIQALITYGIKDLGTVLAQDTSKKVIRRIKNQLLKENGLLDAAYSFDIVGMDNFGMRSSEPATFKESHSLAESREKAATRLYEKMKNLVEKEKSHMRRNSDTSDSYIIQALGQATSANGKKALSNVEDIMEIIEEIESLEKELKNARRAWVRSKTPSREVKLNKKAKKSIIITIENGEPKIDIDSLKEALKEDNRFEAFGFKDNKINPQKLKTAITTLKARASKVLREEIISSLEQANFKIPEEQLVRFAREELRDLTIQIDGPYLLEVLPTLRIKQISGTKAVAEWNNYKGKNDSIEILISTGKVKAEFERSNFYKNFGDLLEPVKKRVEQAQQELLKAYQENIDKHVKQMTDDNDYQKYSKMIEVMDTDEKKDAEENERLDAARKELKEATDAYIAEINKQYKMHGERGGITQKQLIKLGKEYMDTLKTSFYVSTTTKSRNEYVDFIGFNGGSLGSSLDAQLARINDIFSSAGLPIDEGDIKWLKSAIINCFPGSVVGEKNKTLIESYIGSLAAFALFDEGAVETNIINNFKTDIVKAITNNKAQKIVHLYLVDGIYVKGSTVLKRTLNTIQNEVIPNIQKIPAVMHRGAGVVIVNNTTEDIIPNRPTRDYYNSPNANAWAVAGQKAQGDGNISIKILFLAGLLDIIHSINATLAEVQH